MAGSLTAGRHTRAPSFSLRNSDFSRRPMPPLSISRRRVKAYAAVALAEQAHHLVHRHLLHARELQAYHAALLAQRGHRQAAASDADLRDGEQAQHHVRERAEAVDQLAVNPFQLGGAGNRSNLQLGRAGSRRTLPLLSPSRRITLSTDTCCMRVSVPRRAARAARPPPGGGKRCGSPRWRAGSAPRPGAGRSGRSARRESVPARRGW